MASGGAGPNETGGGHLRLCSASGTAKKCWKRFILGIDDHLYPLYHAVPMSALRSLLPTLEKACPACSSRMAIRPLQPRRIPLRFASTSAPTASAPAKGLSVAETRAAMEASRQRLYAARAKKSKSIMLYAISTIVLSAGVTYAAVPLYRAFCSATGFAGTPMTDPAKFSPDRLYTTPETEQRKRITVHFQATASNLLDWTFAPQQRSVRVLPGETALAFYRAKNTGPDDVIGIATYNMTPDRIAPYFAKVECFCFEEQKIRAGEEVDLPVFFFIDRDICDDPIMDGLDDVVLSYTFFRAKRNNKGHAIPDASDEAVLKSQGFDKYDHEPANTATAATATA